MSLNSMDEHWVPEHVKEYLRGLGLCSRWMTWSLGFTAGTTGWGARRDFYDYRDKDGLGRVYEVHRRSIHPAMRVCKEWSSLLPNEDVKVVCENQEVTDWIGSFFSSANFMAQAQATVVRAFGLGTGAWALWVDLDKKKVRIRYCDAKMVIPLTWNEDGITECAFVTRTFYRGKAVDQLQMHLKSSAGFSAALSQSSSSSSSRGLSNGLLAMDDEETYKIVTVCFDHEGNEVSPVGVAPVFDTGCPFPPSAS